MFFRKIEKKVLLVLKHTSFRLVYESYIRKHFNRMNFVIIHITLVYLILFVSGLTMLLPYLLSRNKLWTGCSIRVLTPAAEKSLKSNQVRMASLLKKFRITFSGIVEVQGINSKPTEESIQRFRESRIRDEISSEDVIDKKTLRQIRLSELVQEHSNGARLIVLTMPIPRKGMISNLLFMSWLEVISQNVNPPILLVRGNQTNVLTFYS